MTEPEAPGASGGVRAPHVSPLMIDIMLWYCTRPGDYRNGDLSAPAVRKAVYGFLDCCGGPMLLQYVADGRDVPPGEARFKITDRGIAWVDALCSTPYPIKKWVQP